MRAAASSANSARGNANGRGFTIVPIAKIDNGVLPAVADREIDELFWKLSSNNIWQPRRFAVSKGKLYITPPNSDSISDIIPLVTLPDVVCSCFC